MCSSNVPMSVLDVTWSLWILEWRWEMAAPARRTSPAFLSLPAESDSRASLQPHAGWAASAGSPEKADEDGQLQGSWRRQCGPLIHTPGAKPGRGRAEAVAMLRRAAPAGRDPQHSGHQVRCGQKGEKGRESRPHTATSDLRVTHPYGRKRRRTKEPLDESERGE